MKLQKMIFECETKNPKLLGLRLTWGDKNWTVKRHVALFYKNACTTEQCSHFRGKKYSTKNKPVQPRPQGFSLKKWVGPGPTHFLREKPWGRGWNRSWKRRDIHSRLWDPDNAKGFTNESYSPKRLYSRLASKNTDYTVLSCSTKDLTFEATCGFLTDTVL